MSTVIDSDASIGRRDTLRSLGGILAAGSLSLAGCVAAPGSETEDGDDGNGEHTSDGEGSTADESPDDESDETVEPEEGDSSEEVVDVTGESLVEVELGDSSDDEAPFAFDPNAIRIDAGTTVRWINTHDVFHTVTSTDSLEEKSPSEIFRESLSGEGDEFEFTFDEPGTQLYYCEPHAGFMEGTIDVV